MSRGAQLIQALDGRITTRGTFAIGRPRFHLNLKNSEKENCMSNTTDVIINEPYGSNYTFCSPSLPILMMNVCWAKTIPIDIEMTMVVMSPPPGECPFSHPLTKRAVQLTGGRGKL